MLRTLAAAALATSVVAVAAPASAQEDNVARPMGLRLEVGLVNHSMGVIGTAEDTPDVSGISPTGDIKIGYDFGQFTPLLGLSYRSVSEETGEDSSDSASVFLINLEGRYYFKPHRKGLNPFVFGEFRTSFVSFGANPEPSDEEQDRLDAKASLLDFTEINAGLGLEYKFDGAAFAVGGKWGLGLGFNDRDSGNDTLGTTTIGTVAGVYLAWRL